MLSIEKYKEVVKNSGKVVNVSGMSVIDLININAEILTCYLTAQYHDQPSITADLSGFKEYVMEAVVSAHTHHLGFLADDMEKYKC